jgi:hypothetical protein
MIRNTIIAVILLFILYNAVLVWIHPIAGPGQNQWQKNRITIEDYVDNYQGIPVVIAGTSLSARLYPSLLPQGYYNLALSGESISDVLDIVKRCSKKPKYLLVESNFYYFKPDNTLSDGVFNPLMMPLRKWLPSFREENQPANLLIPLFKKGNTGNNNVSEKVDNSVQNMLLSKEVEAYQQAPDGKIVAEGIEILKKNIAELQSQGVKVIFYEMPIHCSLYNTPKYQIPERQLNLGMPGDKYLRMPLADCSAYQFGDGEHISFQSAVKFADWFVGESKKMGVKP